MTYKVIGVNSEGEEVGCIAAGLELNPDLVKEVEVMNKDLQENIAAGGSMTITDSKDSVPTSALLSEKDKVVEIVFVEEEE